MRRGTASPYRRPVRVIIDFEAPTPEHWSGTLRQGAESAEALRFEGRLQLLRLVESLIERTHEPPTDSDGSTR